MADDNSFCPGEPDYPFPNVHYLPGTDSNPKITYTIIQSAWGEVRDELADFILGLDFEAHIDPL